MGEHAITVGSHHKDPLRVEPLDGRASDIGRSAMPSRKLDFFEVSSLGDLRRRLRDEDWARRMLEWLRWPDGRHCPTCGGVTTYEIKTRRRAGLYECGACGGQFSATSGTPLHATKLPISTWIEAMWLVVTASKGVSSIVLADQIGVSQRTAWKMGHAIRLMMRPADDEPKLSGEVEVDDMTDGGDPGRRRRAKYGAKIAKHIHNPPGRGSDRPRFLTVVERGGRARTAPTKDARRETVEPILVELVDEEAHLMTDRDPTLRAVGKRFAAHDAVNHSAKEYVRGDAHVNTAEGFHLYVQRAKFGVWHFWSETHQHRYLEEIQFRWDHRARFKTVKKKRTRLAERTEAIVKMLALFRAGRHRLLRWTEDGGIYEPEAQAA